MTLDPNTRFAMVVYDIPQRSNLRNPSGMLRRWGFRINLSCWIFPLKNLVLIPIKTWEEAGADVEVVEFGEHEREKIVAMARKAIAKDLDAMRKHVDKSVAKVRKRYDTAAALPIGDDHDQAVKKAGHFAHTTLWRAKELADAAAECALHFDLTGDVADLIDALRRTIKAKSALFYSLAQEHKAKAVAS